jgi:hypothetical protein
VNSRVTRGGLALIPHFTTPSAGNPITQGFILGSVQITISMFVNAAIVLAAGAIDRRRDTRNRVYLSRSHGPPAVHPTDAYACAPTRKRSYRQPRLCLLLPHLPFLKVHYQC